MISRFFYFTIFFCNLVNYAYSNSEIPPSDIKSNQYIFLEYSKPIIIPEFQFFDKDNKAHSPEEFEGKIILLHIWATWNSFSANKLSALADLQRQYKKEGLQIIPLSVDFKGVSAVKDFYEKKKISNLEIYVDDKSKILKILSINTLPCTMIIDRNGLILAKITGTIDWTQNTELKLLLDKYLEKNTEKEGLK